MIMLCITKLNLTLQHSFVERWKPYLVSSRNTIHGWRDFHGNIRAVGDVFISLRKEKEKKRGRDGVKIWFKGQVHKSVWIWNEKCWSNDTKEKSWNLVQFSFLGGSIWESPPMLRNKICLLIFRTHPHSCNRPDNMEAFMCLLKWRIHWQINKLADKWTDTFLFLI